MLVATAFLFIAGVMCYINYADDLLLLASSPSALGLMLHAVRNLQVIVV